MKFNYIEKIINLEKKRQNGSINLIASENLISSKILDLQASIFSSKYAEGYPGKRYYGGCIYVDKIEEYSIDLCKKIFHVKYANVQAHSGSQANQAVYMALCSPGDIIFGLDLNHGGHLSHGFKKNFSGLFYTSYSYYLDKKSEQLDYDFLFFLANKYKPKVIVVGGSAYSRFFNWKTLRAVCDSVGCFLFADISHVAGMIVANLYPTPVGFADVITSTVQKTLRGTRGGIILTNNISIFKKINSSLFPGLQGGPSINIIAAKALSFVESCNKDFIFYQKSVIKNAKLFSSLLKIRGFSIISSGTDTHLFLLNLINLNLTGVLAEKLLEKFRIIVNKNCIPYDTFNSSICSGIRIGTPYITSRGFSKEDIYLLSEIIFYILKKNDSKKRFIVKKLFNLCRINKIYSYEKNL